MTLFGPEGEEPPARSKPDCFPPLAMPPCQVLLTSLSQTFFSLNQTPPTAPSAAHTAPVNHPHESITNLVESKILLQQHLTDTEMGESVGTTGVGLQRVSQSQSHQGNCPFRTQLLYFNTGDRIRVLLFCQSFLHSKFAFIATRNQIVDMLCRGRKHNARCSQEMRYMTQRRGVGK